MLSSPPEFSVVLTSEQESEKEAQGYRCCELSVVALFHHA